MSSKTVKPLYYTFQDIDGQPLENGSLYIGTAGLDPKTNPIQVYWDGANTQPITQPISTINGFPSNNGTPGTIHFATSDYSITAENKNGTTVFSKLAGNSEEVYFSALSGLIGATDFSNGSVVTVGGDRGLGDAFQYDSSVDRTTANEGLVIDPTVPLGSQGTGSGTGCWVRRYNGSINVKWFGAVGDWNDSGSSGTNDTVAFENAVAAACNARHALYVPAGNYYIAPSAPIDVFEGIRFYGDGAEESNLYHKSNVTCFRFVTINSPTPRVPGPRVKFDSFTCHGNSGALAYFVQVNWSYGTTFENILFRTPYDSNFAYVHMYNEGGNWIEGTLFHHIQSEGSFVRFETDGAGNSESFSRTTFIDVYLGIGTGQVGINVRNNARLYDCYFQLHYILENTGALINASDTAKIEQSWITAQGEVGDTSGGTPFFLRKEVGAGISLQGSAEVPGTQSSQGALLTQSVNPAITDENVPYINATDSEVDVSYYAGGNAESTPSYGVANGGSVSSPIIKYWEQGGRNGLLLMKHPTSSSPEMQWLIGENGKVEYYGSEDEITFNKRLLARADIGSLLKLVRPSNGVNNGIDLDFVFYNSDNIEKEYVQLVPEIDANTAGTEGGRLKFKVISNGVLTTSFELLANGNIQSLTTYNNTTASASNMHIDAAGTIFRSTSAAKYKENIEDVELNYANAFIDNARPVNYKSVCEADKNDWSYWGFIAEELEAIDPRLVHYAEDEGGNLTPEGVQYERISVLLTKVVQEQKAQIADLTARIEALEAK